MKNPPAFQFYPKDFISDAKVQAMTLEERGMYITLLCHCWIEDGLLDDDSDPIASLLKHKKIARCFIKKNGKFFNPRLLKEKRKQLAYRKSLQAAGLRGAEKRWGRHSQPIATPMAKHGSSSSSSNSSIPPYSPPKGTTQKRGRNRRFLSSAAEDREHRKQAKENYEKHKKEGR